MMLNGDIFIVRSHKAEHLRNLLPSTSAPHWGFWFFSFKNNRINIDYSCIAGLWVIFILFCNILAFFHGFGFFIILMMKTSRKATRPQELLPSLIIRELSLFDLPVLPERLPCNAVLMRPGAQSLPWVRKLFSQGHLYNTFRVNWVLKAGGSE